MCKIKKLIGELIKMIGKIDKTETTINSNDYCYYSNLLQKPFATVEELKKAEAKHYAELKAKEDKAAAKKQDALKVECAFKELNAARKIFKEDLEEAQSAYHKNLKALKDDFEKAKAEIYARLSEKENAYSDALKAFTAKHPEGYHLTLKDGDFETTIGATASSKNNSPFNDLFDLIFRF